jgi:predicted PurR-regulated permease PerM
VPSSSGSQPQVDSRGPAVDGKAAAKSAPAHSTSSGGSSDATSVPPEYRRSFVTPGVRAASEWVWRLGVIALGIYVLSLVFREFSEVFVPLVIALLLSALLHPLVHRLAEHIPRGVASLIALLGTLLVIIGLFSLVAQQASSGFPDLYDQGVAGLDQARNWLRTGPLHIDASTLAGYINKAQNAAKSNQSTIASGAVGVAVTVTHLVEGLFITLFGTFFFLSSGHRIWAWLLRMFPRAAQRPLDDAARSGWVTLSHYVRATLIVALVDGIGIGTGAALLGVPLAFPLGVLVFLGAFIPVVGAAITGVLAVLVALVANGPIIALAVLGVVLLVQQVEAHVLQPFLLGRAVDVHPLAVIVAIASGAVVAGIVGALFAVPFVAVANTMISSLAGRREDPGERIADEDAPFTPHEPAATDLDRVPDPQDGPISGEPKGG